MRAVWARRHEESGFTFLELLVSMVVFGVLVGISAGPYATYRAKQQHIGASRELVAFLRRAQVRAVSEETTYRVDFATDGKSATAYRFNGSSYVAGQVLTVPTSRIRFTSPSFLASDGTSSGSVFFYARGSGSKGSVTVTRQGGSKTYTVDVEGLTARVSYK